MNSIITICIVVIFAGMFIAMLVAQGKHRTKLARQAKIAELTTQIKRLQNTLRTLPGKYWTVELRDFVFQSLITAYRQCIEIHPSQKEYLQSDMQLIINQRQQFKNNPQSQSSEVEPSKVNVYRSALKSLHSYTQDSYTLKRIPNSMAESLIEQIEVMMLEAIYDFYIHNAKQNLEAEKYREAHNQSQKAIEAISKSKHRDQFKQHSIELNNFISDIQTTWREYTAERNQASLANNSLSQSLDSLEDDQDTWQQKQDYD
ncbi:hypothetical protein [Marinicellulosiphila megalodicopiae]|uniref:hypothetical protein n=1 Tax=Marinicellulosiphila megalodicopiae TaxID=2724896 RepID=UPI003BB1AB14